MEISKATAICEAHEKAMDETPGKIVDLIFDSFPYGISASQIDIIIEETKELLHNKPLVPVVIEGTTET